MLQNFIKIIDNFINNISNPEIDLLIPLVLINTMLAIGNGLESYKLQQKSNELKLEEQLLI